MIMVTVYCNRPWKTNTVFNQLAPGKFQWNFIRKIFKQILVTDGWGITCEIALIWISLGFNDDQSTLVQVMACCHQATSHYLSQWWPISLSPYGVTRLSLGHNELSALKLPCSVSPDNDSIIIQALEIFCQTFLGLKEEYQKPSYICHIYIWFTAGHNTWIHVLWL